MKDARRLSTMLKEASAEISLSAAQLRRALVTNEDCSPVNTYLASTFLHGVLTEISLSSAENLTEERIIWSSHERDARLVKLQNISVTIIVNSRLFAVQYYTIACATAKLGFTSLTI